MIGSSSVFVGQIVDTARVSHTSHCVRWTIIQII